MNVLGRMPGQGDEVEVNGYNFRVEQMEGRRIDRVRITRVAPVSSAGDEVAGEAQ